MGRRQNDTDTREEIIPSPQSIFVKYLRHYLNSGWVYCLSMILILFCIRNAMVLSDMWTSYDGGDLPEALTAGNFAYDILDGVWRGWNFYLGYTSFHTGWALIPSCIAIPLYYTLGPSLLTLCQVPILFSAAIIYMIYRLCSRYFDKTVALLSIALFVFLPLRIHKWAVYPYCTHLEAAFYTLLVLSLFLKVRQLQSAGPTKKSRQYIILVLFGLASGLSVFHSEMHLVMLASIFVFWLFCEPRFVFRKDFVFFFIPALLIGLIPYFIFSPLLSPELIKDWITRHWQTTYSYNAANGSLGLLGIKGANAMISLFWPVHHLSFGMLSGIPLLLLGGAIAINFQRRFRFKRSETDVTLILNIIRAFVFVHLGFLLTSAFEFEAYAFPVVAYVCILFAIAIRDLLHTGKWGRKPIFRAVVLIVVALCCGCNLYDILKNISPQTWASNIRLQLSRKGTSVGTYLGRYVPAGFKTALTIKVEAASQEPILVRYPYDKFQKRPITVTENSKQHTVDIWYLNDIEGRLHQVKVFFVNSELKSMVVLDVLSKLDNLWKYGMDVTFTGLEILAREAKWRGLTDQLKERVFMSIAVYYNSNYWMNSLLAAYQNKDVEKVVPEPFRKYFYQEFGRRLRSQYGANKKKIAKVLHDLSTEQKTAIMLGYDMATYYLEAPSYHRVGYQTDSTLHK